MALTYPITPLPKKLWAEVTDTTVYTVYPPPVVSKEVCEQNVKYYTELLAEEHKELKEKILNLTTFAETTNKKDLIKLLGKLYLNIKKLNTKIKELKEQLKILTDRISRIDLDFTGFSKKSPLLIEQLDQIKELKREETKILNETIEKQNTLSSVMKKSDILKLFISNASTLVKSSSSFIDEFDTLVRSFIAVEKNILDAKDKLTEWKDKLTKWHSKQGIKRKKSRRYRK